MAMKSGDQVRIKESGRVGTVKAVFYHYDMGSVDANVHVFVSFGDNTNERTEFLATELEKVTRVTEENA